MQTLHFHNKIDIVRRSEEHFLIIILTIEEGNIWDIMHLLNVHRVFGGAGEKL